MVFTLTVHVVKTVGTLSNQEEFVDDDERRRVRSESIVAEVGRLQWMASFKKTRELLLFSVENNTINEEEFFLLSEGLKSVTRLSNEKAWIESNKTELVLLSYTFYRS